MATALADSGVEQFTIKCALNHKDNSVTGVYDKSFHIKMKSSALIKWRASSSIKRHQNLLQSEQ
jgi:hypothetical protein